MKNKHGSNGYKVKYHNWLGLSKKAYNSVLWLILLLLVIFWAFKTYYRPPELISPVSEYYPSGVCGTDRCRLVPPAEATIEGMIKDTFKEDAGKAFKLLSCENGRLNPNAVNINKDGSRDLGVFQISEYWQRTQGKFLLNPKVNIEIAHQLFMENGKSFKLWTCAKKVGLI